MELPDAPGNSDATPAVLLQKETEAALRKSEAIARGMFETAVDAIITIDEVGAIGSFNPAAERLFGYSAAEVIGKNVRMLMPEPYRGEHDGYLRRYCQTGEARIIGIGREVVAQKKDGSLFPMDLAVGKQKIGDQWLFTGMIRDLTERKQLERQNVEISGREQQRIAQDLHDGLGQHLTGVAFLAQALATRLDARGSPDANDAEKLAGLLGQAITQTRSLARGLLPVTDSRSLPSALADMASAGARMFSIDCQFTLSGESPHLDVATSSHLYRIAQEAVHNAVRHGHAGHVQLALSTGPASLTLTVQSDGLPFAQTGATGLGLRIMRYRASIIGARLDIGPGASAGTVVRCVLAPPPTKT